MDPLDDPKKMLVSNLIKIAASNVSAISEDLVMITLIPMYIFFILLYRGHLIKFIHQRYEGSVQTQALAFVGKAKESINNYIKGTLILTGISAVMTYVILLLFGIKAAFFFGVFLAILNLIPYVGNLIGMIVILVFAFVSKDSISTTLLIAVTIYISNLIQENFLKPKLIGDKMEMNAGVVFTSVIIGGLIWGFSGMILFIPLSGIVKAFLDSSPSSKSFSVFFES
ncbi:MAG: AI-2E family transporter [Cytophagales bacterium]|nr:AI-2E family transporter [Cytophagales bacterium]